jgi:hypothetical protein
VPKQANVEVAGTLEGTLTGTAVGDPCVFSGMKAHGKRIHATCVVAEPEWRGS